MKLLKRCMSIFIVFIYILCSYPQAMLIQLNSGYVEPLLIVDKNISEKNNYLNIDVKIPQINGLSNKESEKVINSKIINFTDLWINEVKSIANEYYGSPNNVYPLLPYELITKYNIKNQNKILSFYIEYYQFTGGAHGITQRVAFNIDIDSGNELLLKDLFLVGYKYEKSINKEIEKEINKNPDIYFLGKDGFNGVIANQKFYIDGENLVIIFDQYEIAPYVTGIPEFKIPLKMFGKSFKYANM